ncbi:MAG TPA: hypothetical protein VGK67_27155 [Myxococcales bacterium]
MSDTAPTPDAGIPAPTPAAAAQEPAPTPAPPSSTPAKAGLGERVRGFLMANWIPIAVAVVCAVVLGLFSWHRFLHQSKAPHFIYQAMAWLEGRLDIPVDPPNQEDWVKIGEKFYQSFPAFPAVVMLPFVAWFGYQFNDTSFSVFMAALGLALFYVLLRRLSQDGESKRTVLENLAFTFLLGFGTLFFYCAIRGEVWFTAEVMATGLTSLYVLFAVRARRPILAGLCWSMAGLTRTPVLFAGIFFVAEVLWPSGSFSEKEAFQDLKAKLKKLALFAAAAAPLGLAHAWFNWARFGSPTKFGHEFFWNNRVNADISKWGLFHYQYLERNLTAAFTKLPTITFNPLRIGYDPHGMSLLVTTPLLLLLLWPKEKPRLHKALWLTVACTAIPGFFYQNDGYMQFGFRFSLDYTPFLMLLLVVGGWSLRSRLFAVLAVLGVVVNTWGAVAFRGYSW